MKIQHPAHSPWNERIWYGVTIAVLTILIASAGYTAYQQQKELLMGEKKKEISTITDLKTSQLVQWRKERFADGVSIRANAMIARRITDYLTGKDRTGTQQEFNRWLSSLIDLGEYSQALLFSADGTVITSHPKVSAPLNQHYYSLVAEARREHELILSDFHSDGPGDPYDLNMAIPIMHPDSSEPLCIAVLILDIDPTKRLYPLIQAWPAASNTAETVLAMRVNDSVLFLNDHRHRKNNTTPYLLPLAKRETPAVMAVLGYEGSFQGIDYRNVPVLCSTRTIPGTNWGLVAKIDISEIVSQLSTSITVIILVGTILEISMIMGLFLWGSRRKEDTLRKLVGIEQKFNAELKESEDSLKKSRDYHLKLLEIFPSLVWRSGVDSTCNYFNQTWLSFTGRSIEQELGNGWVEGVHPEDRQHCLDIYSEAFREQREFSMDYRLRFNDGTYRWINDHGRPYYDLNGVFAGFIGSCFDINIQRTAEAELQGIHARLEQQIIERTKDLSEINVLLRLEIEERQQLEQQLLSAKRLEAIGQIAGGVAHEVRNPLNAILTITEALFREKEIAANPEFEPFILHIRTQVNRLVHLMNDLLDLGRSIPATNLQPVQLYDVCRETLQLWKSSGMAKNKRALMTSDSDDISITVSADILKLQQILFNLLENAGHHTPDGGKISICLKCIDQQKYPDMARVQIIDQGIGIDDVKLPHVFEPFYTGRQGGTGLGLALVKHFLENMGGSVQIWNNSPPPGCTVEICIPLYLKELQ
jgi:PAS domain S-box-containing protein